MPRPAAVATVKRIVTDGKEGARRVAIYYAGGAKVQEIGTSEREIKGAAHYYADAGARWFGGSCAALGVVEGSVFTSAISNDFSVNSTRALENYCPTTGLREPKSRPLTSQSLCPRNSRSTTSWPMLKRRVSSTRSSKKRTDPHWSTHRPTGARCAEVKMASFL